MEQNFKSITKQLVIAAFILATVTVLSFGIRRVRFGAHRADTGESTPSAHLSDTEDQSQPEQSLNADAELDDSYTVDAEPDPQYTDASDWDEQAPSDDYSEEHTDSAKSGKTFSNTKSFKGGYAKSEGKKSLQTISLGDNANIYLTEKGEAWYVSKEADGSTSKMQVQVDGIAGDITLIGSGYYGKSEGSQGPQRISMSDNADIYLTDKGETWYVSEQADGSTTKVQLEEDITGEIDIVDSGENK